MYIKIKNNHIELIKSANPYLIFATIFAFVIGLYYSLFQSPPDYVQGDSVRIMYVHVPSAWISLISFVAISFFCILNFLFKLKNVYNFIYLRTYKINRMSEGYIDILPKKDGRISGEEINTLFNNYIKHENEKTKYIHAIIIMNGIQLYFFPSISLL